MCDIEGAEMSEKKFDERRGRRWWFTKRATKSCHVTPVSACAVDS
jgi:hypothetical protein